MEMARRDEGFVSSCFMKGKAPFVSFTSVGWQLLKRGNAVNFKPGLYFYYIKFQKAVQLLRNREYRKRITAKSHKRLFLFMTIECSQSVHSIVC